MASAGHGTGGGGGRRTGGGGGRGAGSSTGGDVGESDTSLGAEASKSGSEVWYSALTTDVIFVNQDGFESKLTGKLGRGAL